jgi:hypothetical protein
VEEQKDRFESTEPETDDVEGHRLKDDPEPKADRLRQSDRNADEPDVEAHRLVDRNMDRNVDRNMDRNVDRNVDRNID